jgi:hypothetical protein
MWSFITRFEVLLLLVMVSVLILVLKFCGSSMTVPIPEPKVEEQLDIGALGPIKDNMLEKFVATIEGGLSYEGGGCNPAIFRAQMRKARLEVITFANTLRRECQKKSGIAYVGLLMEKRPYFHRDAHVGCALASIINDEFFADFNLPQFGSTLPTAAVTYEELIAYSENRGTFPGLTDFQAWMTKKDSTLCMALELEQEDQVSDGVKIRSLNSLEDSKAKFYEAA